VSPLLPGLIVTLVGSFVPDAPQTLGSIVEPSKVSSMVQAPQNTLTVSSCELLPAVLVAVRLSG
jgi:hypothetical protein